MTYRLKGGEEIRDGKLFGWTGRHCPVCHGSGDYFPRGDSMESSFCRSCAGTGEEWGLMPVQPADLPHA